MKTLRQNVNDITYKEKNLCIFFFINECKFNYQVLERNREREKMEVIVWEGRFKLKLQMINHKESSKDLTLVLV